MPNQIKNRILSVIFLFFLVGGFAQSKVADSLLQLLSQHQERDTIKVGLLVNTAWNLTHTDPNNAFAYVEEALKISADLDWSKGTISALRQKGNLYYVMGDNLNALDAFQEGLKIAQDEDEKILEASLYGNIGNIYADFKENEEALENYNAYLQTAIQLDQKPDQVRALSNIGLIYNDMDAYAAAISYFEKALALAREEGNNYFIAAIINNLGIAYKDKKDYTRSLEYYQQAAQISHTIQNRYIEASALNSIGKVNILLEDYEAAGSKAEEALGIAEQVNAVEWQADSWDILSLVYEKQYQYQMALYAYKKHIQLRDSVINEEKKAELTKKEMQFQLKRQEAEANATIKRQRLVKNGALIGGIVLLLASIIGYLLYKRRRDAIEQRKIAEFNTKVAETELKALRSQMNPHFIFNALNSIGDYIAKNDIVTANTYLLKFAKLTRAILESSEKKWISLEEDIELIELYIQIEALRLKNKLNYTLHIPADIDLENTMVPPLLSQPFIENSIWHGIANKKGMGKIEITLKKHDGMIICVIDDDGVGRKVLNVQSPKKSMGLRIAQNRLDIISQLKKAKGSIEIFDKEQGLRVELKMPLELRF
ncbi:MAG: tetratricopeptide repeat protein [Bacteroidota bacterium]